MFKYKQSSSPKGKSECIFIQIYKSFPVFPYVISLPYFIWNIHVPNINPVTKDSTWRHNGR